MVLTSTLTCPTCGHQATETMPTDACQVFYVCAACGTRLRPHPGDCCVFCSYGTVPCPPVQAEQDAGTDGEASAVDEPGPRHGDRTYQQAVRTCLAALNAEIASKRADLMRLDAERHRLEGILSQLLRTGTETAGGLDASMHHFDGPHSPDDAGE